MANEEPRITDRRASADPEAEGGAEETETNANDTQDIAAQLADERDKAQAYLANWQRAAADYANLKRRMEQEREELGRFGNAALLINILPLMDDLERALQSVDSRLAGMTWLDGIRLIHRKFEALLQINGVTEIAADGESFDPNVHEAVMFGEGEEGKVIGVVQKGYKLGDRVLRPSMVVVGKSQAQ